MIIYSYLKPGQQSVLSRFFYLNKFIAALICFIMIFTGNLVTDIVLIVLIHHITMFHREFTMLHCLLNPSTDALIR